MKNFFGESNPFQLITNLIVYLNACFAFYTFYKMWLEKAKIKLYHGDRIGLVRAFDSPFLKLHIRGGLVNRSAKTGVLNRLEVELKTPNRKTLNYEWNIFFKYQSEFLDVVPAGNVVPIVVKGRDSSPFYVEMVVKKNDSDVRKKNCFSPITETLISSSWVTNSDNYHIINHDTQFRSQELDIVSNFSGKIKHSGFPLSDSFSIGQYEVKIKGWVNISWHKKPNLQTSFSFTLLESDLESLGSTTGNCVLDKAIEF